MLEALTRLPLAPSAYPSLFLLSSLESRDDSGGGSGSRFDDLLRVFQPQREALRGRRRKGAQKNKLPSYLSWENFGVGSRFYSVVLWCYEVTLAWRISLFLL